MSRTVTGRLVFQQAGPKRPLHNMAFTAAVHHPLLPDRPLGRLRTDLDGRFSVELPTGRELTLRITLQERHRLYKRGSVVDEDIASTQVDVHLEERTIDLGDVPVGFWPYRTDFPTPRAGAVDGKLAQSYTKGFSHTLAKAVARSAPVEGLLLAQNALDHEKPSMAEIQKHQPETLTLKVEAETPGKTRSDLWLGDQLLNGFNIELRVGRDADDPARFRAVIDWGDMPAKGLFDLADVDVVLLERPEGMLPVRITARIRQPGQGGAWASDETRTFTPEDDDWDAAKRLVRCQYLLHGALHGHIIRAHFQTEMYALAVFRNLHLNPVRDVLAPHLWEIVAQGHDGDNFAWGPEGILATQSAVTTAVLYQRMADASATMDWKTFQPRTVLHNTHRYAKAARLYWDMVGQTLDDFFREHQAGIVAHWAEVRRFSDDLVDHSLPYAPQPDDPRVVPVDRNELDHPDVPRVSVDGVTRTCRPVTLTDTPAEGELAALQQLCHYVIFNATFNHSWTHNGQYDAGGELAYATFSLRNGSIGGETDPAINPPPKLSIKSISTNTLGTRANYGFILADEEHDVPPALKAALKANADAFRALGQDPGYIRSRINI
ncbi:MAG: hypothetical protein H6739_42515 [Alphaproteobacteria bacterium]|nr:hypothetical protein [Alphaproteobacteria bacterium]